MKNDMTDLYKEIIIPIITAHVPGAKIIIYGSRARGDFKEGSDIDIALDTNGIIDNHVMTELTFALDESKLPIKFDLVDLYGVSERMKQAILKDGIAWKK